MKKILVGLLLAGLFSFGRAEATCDISSSFTAGQVLTAAQLNTLVTDSEACTNNVLNGDTFTGNMSWHSGVDALFYSDTGSTLKAGIDGATGHFIGAPSMEGFHTNCGISNSGTTLTIAGYDGTALSATNPCVVAIRSNTAGRTALAFFTANVTVTHGATSNTDGNLFGITDANWASTMPFFLGVVYDGSTPYFTISRLPYVVTGAASTAFCEKDDTDCDAQLDMMFLVADGTLTLANWVNLPVTQIGWFDATYATTGGAWTFAVTGKNGFNRNYESVEFVFPTGQNGATSGSWYSENGSATSLTFTVASSTYTYYIRSSGWVTCHHKTGTRDASDATASAFLLHTPYLASNHNAFSFGLVKVAGTFDVYVFAVVENGAYAYLYSPAGATQNVASFSNANDAMDNLTFGFQAF